MDRNAAMEDEDDMNASTLDSTTLLRRILLISCLELKEVLTGKKLIQARFYRGHSRANLLVRPS